MIVNDEYKLVGIFTHLTIVLKVNNKSEREKNSCILQKVYNFSKRVSESGDDKLDTKPYKVVLSNV